MLIFEHTHTHFPVQLHYRTHAVHSLSLDQASRSNPTLHMNPDSVTSQVTAVYVQWLEKNKLHEGDFSIVLSAQHCWQGFVINVATELQVSR